METKDILKFVEKYKVGKIFISLSTVENTKGQKFYYCTFRKGALRKKIVEQKDLYVSAEEAIKALKG